MVRWSFGRVSDVSRGLVKTNKVPNGGAMVLWPCFLATLRSYLFLCSQLLLDLMMLQELMMLKQRGFDPNPASATSNLRSRRHSDDDTVAVAPVFMSVGETEEGKERAKWLF